MARSGGSRGGGGSSRSGGSSSSRGRSGGRGSRSSSSSIGKMVGSSATSSLLNVAGSLIGSMIGSRSRSYGRSLFSGGFTRSRSRSNRRSYRGSYDEYDSYDERDHRSSSPPPKRKSFNVILFGVIAVVILLIALFIVSSTSKYSTTTVREPLPKQALSQTAEYYHDGAKIISDSEVMAKGLKYFQSKTGIQPFIYTTTELPSMYDTNSDDDLFNYTNDIYGSLFQDEGHLIYLLIINGQDYVSYYLTGESAGTVFDQSAADIFFKYENQYLNGTTMGYSEALNLMFSKTADVMMKKPFPVKAIIIAAIILVVIASIGGHILIRSLRLSKERAEATERILNTDIDDL